MRNKMLYIVFAVILFGAFIACDTIPEPIVIQKKTGGYIVKTPEYYENLRAFKRSGAPLFYGYFSNWTGTTTGGNAAGSFKSLPDSIGWIAIWSNYGDMTPEKKEDLRFAQEVLGMKILITFIPGNFYPQSGLEEKEENIPAYAAWIADSILSLGYDGLDMDIELDGKKILGDIVNCNLFIRELGKYMGPLSGTEHLLFVDGNVSQITAETCPYINYFLSQTYGVNSPSTLQSRYNGIQNRVKPEQFIIAENFESYWATGGVNYSDDEGNISFTGEPLKSMEGMARWNPTQGRKGGCGAYRLNYDYANIPDYKYVRRAIQVMTPALR